ncbi:MAG: hypothetical protein WKH64_16650 [Chloroflexia bacterium]
MSRIVGLLLLLPPLVALVGGVVLAGAAGLHLWGKRRLPGVRESDGLSAVAALLLGTALAGVGFTYVLTDGETGHDGLYIYWLALALGAGLLTLAPRRG